MTKLFQALVRITGFIPYLILFRTKTYYEDKKVQNKKVKGRAILISNHTSVYDYAVLLFTFPFRTIRCLMAELLFDKKPLGLFLKCMGGIKVDRDNYNFTFISKCEKIIDKKGVVAVFPESRLPNKNEERPLPFKPSASYIAYLTDAPIIPMYTNGSYFNKKRARVIIGKPINISDYIDNNLTEKENFNKILRERVIELGKELERQTSKEK